VKAGDVIKAVQTDEAGNVSDESTVTVGGDNGEVPGTTPGTDNTGDNGSVDNTDAPDQTDDTKVPSEPGTSEPTEGTDNSAEVPSTDAPTADNGTNAQTSNGVEAPAATETKAPEAATADSKAQPSKAQESKELPDTGNSTGNATIFGGLFAALGSVFLFNRRKKDSKENK
ncbi:LPXTG cell wall anchor domain-containing protein, partial [Staphylococcus sp. EZ-P03]|uniref:LPXTG cell wall anchor domain-containing protein n=1 Tax=Staphylococcus sp. EZ-P03 TaxID=2282739 RepID=UPI0013C485ED